MKETSLQQAIAICKIAGCEFTKEELADLAKVERGEMTFDDIEKKLFAKLAVLKQQHPEYFDTPAGE